MPTLAGIRRDQIILDPGIGFGKSLEQKHNLILLKHLRSFKVLNQPLLIGTSRKAFIGRILGLPPGGAGGGDAGHGGCGHPERGEHRAGARGGQDATGGAGGGRDPAEHPGGRVTQRPQPRRK